MVSDGGFLKWGYPQTGWFILEIYMEILLKTDDLGIAEFSETSISFLMISGSYCRLYLISEVSVNPQIVQVTGRIEPRTLYGTQPNGQGAPTSFFSPVACWGADLVFQPRTCF